MLNKITWKADVEEGSELSIDDVKVLADAINILVIEHNRLVDVINQNFSNDSAGIGSLGGMLGALASGFSGNNNIRSDDSLSDKIDEKDSSEIVNPEENH